MLDTHDIKKLTEYQLEVFKNVFMTKEDGKGLENKIDRMQPTIDGIAKMTHDNNQEIIVLNHKIQNGKPW